MMKQIFRALSNRVSVGLWRLRKQFVWVACLIAGIFLLYIQFVPSSSANYTLKDGQMHPRSLHSYAKMREIEGMNSHATFNDKTAQRVQFLSNDYLQQNNNIERTEYRVAHPISENNIFQEDTNILRQSDTIRQSEAQGLLDQRIRLQQRSRSENELPVDTQHELEIDNYWMGGMLKYNNFGEPQYDHTSRTHYIPKERIIHFDLKGAPPKAIILIKLIPWLAKHGATAVLLEYEDMFPWDGTLSSLAAKNHYTKKEIRQILAACKESNLQVIPLVQTFGHLEFALKGRLFAFLREIPDLPQALCPSKNDSSLLIRAMIDQIMRLHPHVKYLHIGCDEVFQIGDCDKCRLKSREDLFLRHVSSIAKYVINSYSVKPLIWHDMLIRISSSAMKEYNFGELVEPMVWVYAEDIYRFVQPSQWSKLADTFPYVWGASAFKGAFGEQATLPNARRHLDNNLNWLDVMSTENAKFTGGFRGLVITGWQRFDHFAVLCEILPVAMPSLAVNLIAISHGFFNSTIEDELQGSLKCVQASQNTLDLDSDPFLLEKYSWCFFPGSQAFKLAGRVDDMKKEVRAYLDKVKHSRGWITDYNIRHNFSSPMRVDEDLDELPMKLQMLEMLVKSANEALSEWFDGWTTGEWIEQHIWPLIEDLKQLEEQAESMKMVKIWPPRPLKLLSVLAKYNVTEPPLRKNFKKKHALSWSPESQSKKYQNIP